VTTATVGSTAAIPPRAASAARPRKFISSVGATGAGWAFVAPFLVFFALFLVWPLLHGLYLSFTGTSLTGANQDLIGFANYAEALSDPIMWRALLNTLWFTIASTVPLVLVALGLALLVNQGLPGQWLWRLSFFAPFLLASTVAAQIWIWIYNPQLGFLNDVLATFGVAPVAWLQDPAWAMFAIVVTTLWWTVGFNFLIYLAALQNIPEQQFEAAAIDGASRWRQVRSISIPQLGPTTALVTVLQILASLKLFDQVYIMTQGGPNGVTRSIVLYMYEVGFTGYRFGYASSIAYIFFAIVVIVSLLQFRLAAQRSAR
jgi:multiple sugar transport system permease protein